MCGLPEGGLMDLEASALAPPRRRMVPISNRWGAGEMAVLDFGDPSRPVDLVFVHANGFNARTYRSLLQPLSHVRRIWAPDLRGHGLSRLPTRLEGRRNWHDHRDDLGSLLDHLEGPPVALAGHSIGGTSGLMAAAERPGRVAGLLLLDPVIWRRGMVLAMNLPMLDRMAGRNPLVAATLRRRAIFDNREQALAAYRGRGAFRGWPDGVLADYLADGLQPTGRGLELACAPAWEASNYAAQAHDPWRALRRYDGPVQVMKAETGSLCAVSPGARSGGPLDVRTVSGGHLFPMTHPHGLGQALLDLSA